MILLIQLAMFSAAASAVDTISLQSLRIAGSHLEVIYSSSADACVHLLDEQSNIVHVHNHFCENGVNLKAVPAISDFSVQPGKRYKLCHGNNYLLCSQYATAVQVACDYSPACSSDGHTCGNCGIIMNCDSWCEGDCTGCECIGDRRANGQSCMSDSDCCSGNCLSGVCRDNSCMQKGAVQYQACGKCGVQKRVCDGYSWGSWSACADKTVEGGACSDNSDCCSGICKEDWDNPNEKFCAGSNQCVHNNNVYNSGTNSGCKDSCTHTGCNSGRWEYPDCGPYACTNGQCTETCSKVCGAQCETLADCGRYAITCGSDCKCHYHSNPSIRIEPIASLCLGSRRTFLIVGKSQHCGDLTVTLPWGETKTITEPSPDKPGHEVYWFSQIINIPVDYTDNYIAVTFKGNRETVKSKYDLDVYEAMCTRAMTFPVTVSVYPYYPKKGDGGPYTWPEYFMMSMDHRVNDIWDEGETNINARVCCPEISNCAVARQQP